MGKAVELDNLFGGLPIQHREVQGFESARFKDQFPDGIMIKKGGMESGLAKAETNAHEAKLFKVAGGSRPVMTEVDMAWSSMNHGDVFVLDSGKKIFVWKGSGASGQEKMTAGLIAAKMKDHMGEEIVHVDDGDEEAECDEEWTEHLPLDGRGDCVRGRWGRGGRVRRGVDRALASRWEGRLCTWTMGTRRPSATRSGPSTCLSMGGDRSWIRMQPLTRRSRRKLQKALIFSR